MRFSHRLGVVSSKPIQLGSIDDSLRNRLYNSLNRVFPERWGYYTDYDKIRNYALDKLGFNVEEAKNSDFNEYFLKGPWYAPYDAIELAIEAILNINDGNVYARFEKESNVKDLVNNLQHVLEEEKSGYRLLNNRFIPITSEVEIDAIEKASKTEFEAVNIHIRKATLLYADRNAPDYENSIKESISAVESLCCIITGAEGGQATLGKTLKKLEDNGVVIHRALQEAFTKLYGFSSDQNGIRHGGIDFSGAPIEDAKFMLISCSAFINYLIEKWSRLV